MISVIVSTYNREEYLGKCLESLAQQDFSNDRFEIVLVNNISTDSTEEICNDFAGKNEALDFNYFIETNQGISFARNRGIKEAKGDILVFIDDDAFANKDYLSKIDDFFLKNENTAAIGGRIYPQFESEKPRWMSKYLIPLVSVIDLGDNVKLFKAGKYPIGANMAFRKEVFEKLGDFNTELGRKGKGLEGGEEKDIFNRVKENNGLICYLPDAVVYHTVPDSRITNEFIKRQAIGIGLSEWNRINKRNKEKYSRIIEELFKWVVSIGLFFYYSIILKPAKGVMIIRFRWWVSKGLLNL